MVLWLIPARVRIDAPGKGTLARRTRRASRRARGLMQENGARERTSPALPEQDPLDPQRRASLMERLVNLGETLTRPSSVAGVTQAIGRAALALSEGQRAAVYLRSASGVVTCQWSQGLSREYVTRIVTPEGTNPWVHLSRYPDLMCMDLPKGRRGPGPEPVLVQDVRELPPGNEVRRIADGEGYRALGSWPLSRSGKVVGSVSCYYDAPHAWSRSEREVMAAFSLQAAAALEGAFLFEARTQRSAQAEAADTRIAEARSVLETESAELFEAEKNLEAERARLDQARKDLDMEHARLLALPDDLKAEQARLTEIRSAQEAEHIRLTEIRRGQEAEHARLTEARRELEIEQARVTGAQDRLEAENTKLAETRRELAEETTRLSAAQTALQTEHARLLSLQRTLEAEQARLAGARMKGATEADEEQARLSTARRELDEESARLAGARKELDAEYGRLAGAQQALETEHARLADARQKLDSEQARLGATRRELEGEQARLAGMRRELEADHARHAESRTELEAEYSRLSEARRGVEVESARLSEARQELEAEQGRLAEVPTQPQDAERRPADVPADPEPEPTRPPVVERQPDAARARPDEGNGRRPGGMELCYELGGALPAAHTPEEMYRHLVERAATLLRVDRRTLTPEQEVLTLARALEARDAHRPGYSERLVRWAEAAAGMLACEQNQISDIRHAAFFHDLGKIGVPEALLRTPAPLTEEDVAVLRQAPVVAEMVLRPVPGMQAVAHILRHCAEQWDGEGYPDGLKGDAIPLGARILAVADGYGEMTTGRPDRPMLYHLDAVAELRRRAGTLFDPRVVEVFCKVLKRARQETA